MKIILSVMILLFVLLSVPTTNLLAQTEQGPACVNGSPSSQLCNPISYAPDYKSLIFKAMEVLTGFFLFVGVLRIAFAGFRMVTSQGNEETLTAAKSALQWSVMAIILAMFAFVIVQALANYLGAKDLTGSFAGNNPVQNPIAPTDFTALLAQMLTGFLGVAGLFAIFMIVFGGFKYITSGGNEEEATSAKGTLQWAVIGLVVILLSYVIVRATLTFFAG